MLGTHAWSVIQDCGKLISARKNLTFNLLLPLQGLLQELRHLKIKVEELENERNQYEWKLKATKVSRVLAFSNNSWGGTCSTSHQYLLFWHLPCGRAALKSSFPWASLESTPWFGGGAAFFVPPCSFQPAASCKSYFRKAQKAILWE